MADFKVHDWPFNGPGFDQRIDSLKKAMSNVVLKDATSGMLDWNGKFAPDTTTYASGLVDLAGEPLTIETLMYGKRIIEGKPDLDELIVAVCDMMREMRAIPKELRLHPRDFQRLFNQYVKDTPMAIFDDKGCEMNLANQPLRAKPDPNIPPGGWRLESDVDGVGMDALAGPIRRARVDCPRCHMKVEVWVATDWHHVGESETGAKSEEADFLERLRLKVKEKYLEQRGVIVEFLKWSKAHDNRIVNEALVDDFLESKGKP